MVGWLILTVLVTAVLVCPRRWALLAVLAGVMFVAQGVQIDALGINVFSARFLEIAGFLRVLSRREFSFRQLNPIDRAVLWLYLYTTTVFLFRSPDGKAYQIGLAADACLCYFTFRGLVKDMEEVGWFLRAFVFLLVPYTILVITESVTGHNPFTVVGGVEGGSNWMRHGRPRCFGSFQQPDTLGMFAASFAPLFVGMAWRASVRTWAILGICLCLTIVWAANCGGAAAAAGVGLLGWGFWRLRTKMRKVRWGIVAIVLGLALVMKAPVWYIFARASSITGGDGWHRSELINAAVNNIGKWWAVGMPIKDTHDWLPYTLTATGGVDMTNQFLKCGVSAGVFGIVMFVVLLTRAFSNLGRALANIRSQSQTPCDAEYMLWGMGVVLVVHIVDWFGITYFDQMYVVWFMQLAVISTLSGHWIQEGAIQPHEVIEQSETESALRIALLAPGGLK